MIILGSGMPTSGLIPRLIPAAAASATVTAACAVLSRSGLEGVQVDGIIHGRGVNLNEC